MIEDYYSQSFTIYSKTRTRNSSGVVKESLVEGAAITGILDESPTGYRFESLRETYDFTDVLYTGIESTLTEDKQIKYGSTYYDVVSVIDPLFRAHHLEVLLQRSS